MSNKQLWVTLILMVVSAALGYYANVYANKKNNELLVQLLKDQLLCIQNEQASGKTSAQRQIELEIKKRYLQSKLNSLSV